MIIISRRRAFKFCFRSVKPCWPMLILGHYVETGLVERLEDRSTGAILMAK
jgi:hypothetical protein